MASTKNGKGREELLEATARLIAEKDIADFSLKELAKEAGVSQGTLYYYYSTKEDLVLDVMQRHMDGLKIDFDRWLQRHSDGTLTGERFLEIVFYKGVKLFHKAKIHLYLINECMRSGAKVKERYQILLKEWQAEMEKGIQQAFPKVKDTSAYARFLLLLIDGLAVEEVLEIQNKDNSEIIRYARKIGENNE